jgi:hypothetical protein
MGNEEYTLEATLGWDEEYTLEATLGWDEEHTLESKLGCEEEYTLEATLGWDEEFIAEYTEPATLDSSWFGPKSKRLRSFSSVSANELGEVLPYTEPATLALKIL